MTDNRSQLMHAALQLFAQQGYDAVGVQQIVEAVGVTKPTLYHYFQSKRGLFEALVAERSELLLLTVKQSATYNGDVTLCITQTVKAFFDFAQMQPTFYRMLLAMWFAPPSAEYFPVVLELLQKLRADVEEMFLRASQDHGNMRGRHKRYSVTLCGMIDTYIALSLQDYVDLRDEQMIYELVHQFMHGIFS